MFDIAETVAAAVAAGQPVLLVRVVDVQGFSSRAAADVVALTGSGRVGALLDGAADDQLDELVGTDTTPRLAEITVSDAAAHGAGLSCGGRARLLIQPADQLPRTVWQRLTDREPTALVTELAAESTGRTEVYTPATIAGAEDAAPGAARLFARGSSATTIAGDRLVVALWPVPRLVVVGDGLIAEALTSLGGQLGWTTGTEHGTEHGADAAVAATDALSSADAVVVLDHDLDASGAALRAALGSRAGYVGALGSRRTQAARADWLTSHGVEPDAVRGIRGPAGLDIGAFTPSEIAVSIVAEILAVRRGTGAQPLSARSGPIHTEGPNAPPPRYPQS